MLELKLFGTGQAGYCGRPLAGFPNQQPCLLLCYLLLNRQYPHHRERLAAVFWSEHSTHGSRKYLRNALWRLRQTFQSVGAAPDDYLSVSDDSISFLTSSHYWLDTEIFETTIAKCQDLPGQDLTPGSAADLEAAVELYAGDLLEGIYEDWCLYDRERLSLMHLNALTKLMAFHGVNGTYERGLACGERILARDNTREKIHRRMMRLYWLSGDRNAALVQYKRCVQILREELDISPMDQTRQLYQDMLHNQFDPASWPIHRDDPLPASMGPDESVQPLAEHALEKLYRLQIIIDETSTELHHIERLISKALLRTRQSQE